MDRALGVQAAMRASELSGLRPHQVDLARRVVRLQQTKNGTSRTIPLTMEAVRILRLALDNPVRPIDTDLLFFGEHGREGQRRPYQFNPSWPTIKRECGMADLHFHNLRHQAVSRFVEMGLSDQEVAAISGHKSMQMLKQHTHLQAEDLARRLDQMARVSSYG